MVLEIRKEGSADKVDVRRDGAPRGGKKVINFVTPDSICSASLPIPHIRQRASAELFDAVAVKASAPVPHAAKLKSGPRSDLIASRLSRIAARQVFDRGIHLNSIKPLLRCTLDISILNNSFAHAGCSTFEPSFWKVSSHREICVGISMLRLRIS